MATENNAPFMLTLLNVIKADRAALAEGTLQLQSPSVLKCTDFESAERAVCMYRVVEQGRVYKCSVGAAIPDNVYSTDMEGDSVHTMIDRHPIAAPSDAEKTAIFRLQTLHDELTQTPMEDPHMRISLFRAALEVAESAFQAGVASVQPSNT